MPGIAWRKLAVTVTGEGDAEARHIRIRGARIECRAETAQQLFAGVERQHLVHVIEQQHDAPPGECQRELTEQLEEPMVVAEQRILRPPGLQVERDPQLPREAERNRVEPARRVVVSIALCQLVQVDEGDQRWFVGIAQAVGHTQQQAALAALRRADDVQVGAACDAGFELVVGTAADVAGPLRRQGAAGAEKFRPRAARRRTGG